MENMMNCLFYNMLCLILVFTTAVACKDDHQPEVENKDPEENVDPKENVDDPNKPGMCPEATFLKSFDKERLLIGAMAEDMFFTQNPNVLDVRYIYLADAIFTGPEAPTQYMDADSRWWGWWQDRQQPPGQYLRDFLDKTERAGQIPMITYYTFAQTSNAESQVSPANDVSFLTRYFNDWRFMLQQIGNRKAILHIEPDLWGYAQHRSPQSPDNIPAAVRAANPVDGSEFDNTFAGFSRCLIAMVRKYAPNVKVGLHASAWATGNDININRNANLNIQNHAIQAGNYMLALGAGETDFLAVEALDRDADYYRLQRSENRWWDATNQTLPHFSQHFLWVAELKKIIKKPLVWWQLPLGHADSPNTPAVSPFTQGYEQGYKDNRADYFLTHADDIVSLGGVLLAFGAGAGDQTNPLTDGGNLVRLVNNYKQSEAGFGYCDANPDPDPGTDPDPGKNPNPNPDVTVVPALRVASSVSIPDADEQALRNPSWLLDNRGREWVRPLPANVWVVFQLSKPVTHFLFQWMSSANYNYNETQYGAPGSYQIHVSSNSTDGRNGDWTAVADIQNNVWSARAHEIRGNNIQWVRFRVTGGGTNIDEIDIHDLSQSKTGDAVDTWAFIGDSQTADTYWRDPQGAPPFNEQVFILQPDRFPSMINFGIGGNNSGDLLGRLQQTLDNNKGIHFWAICIGANDGNAAQYEQNLTAIINMLIENGKQPVVARIPYRTDSQYNNSIVQSLNEVVDRLTEQYNLPTGPNLYRYFEQNPAHLRDGLHPTYSDGVRAIQRLWAEVACNFIVE